MCRILLLTFSTWLPVERGIDIFATQMRLIAILWEIFPKRVKRISPSSGAIFSLGKLTARDGGVIHKTLKPFDLFGKLRLLKCPPRLIVIIVIEIRLRPKLWYYLMTLARRKIPKLLVPSTIWSCSALLSVNVANLFHELRS